MGSSLLPANSIPPFTFTITTDDVERYREALGVEGDGVPLGLAMRVLRDKRVLSMLSEVLEGRHPIHLAQDYKVFRPLRADNEYLCDVRLQSSGSDRLRIEQSLSDASGKVCLELASDIVLVAP